jgi:hypothetical protein
MKNFIPLLLLFLFGFVAHNAGAQTGDDLPNRIKQLRDRDELVRLEVAGSLDKNLKAALDKDPEVRQNAAVGLALLLSDNVLRNFVKC